MHFLFFVLSSFVSSGIVQVIDGLLDFASALDSFRSEYNNENELAEKILRHVSEEEETGSTGDILSGLVLW